MYIIYYIVYYTKNNQLGKTQTLSVKVFVIYVYPRLLYDTTYYFLPLLSVHCTLSRCLNFKHRSISAALLRIFLTSNLKHECNGTLKLFIMIKLYLM